VNLISDFTFYELNMDIMFEDIPLQSL